MWRRLTRLHTEGGNRIEDSHDSRLPQQIRNDYFLSRSLRYHRCSRSQVSTVTCASVACSDKTCMSRRAAISLLAVLTSVIHPQSTSAYLVDEDVTEKIFAKAGMCCFSLALVLWVCIVTVSKVSFSTIQKNVYLFQKYSQAHTAFSSDSYDESG